MVNWADPTVTDMFGIIGLIVMVGVFIMLIGEAFSKAWYE